MLKKCKIIVQTLHFTGHLIGREQMSAKEAELYEKTMMINVILMLDEENVIHFEDTEKKSDELEQVQNQQSKHVTLH